MPGFSTRDGFHFVTYITGPKHLLLGLRFSNVPSDASVSKLSSGRPCELDEDLIGQAVQQALSRARTEYGRPLYADELRYVEGDSPDYALYQHAAYLLAKRYLDGGEFIGGSAT